MYFPYCQRPCFTPIQNHRQNYSLHIRRYIVVNVNVNVLFLFCEVLSC
jgi:hypothetical protein